MGSPVVKCDMMTKKEEKQAQAALQQKIDDMKRQVKELQSRISEAEMQLSVMKDKRVTTAEDTPLRKLVHLSRIDAFRKVVEVWQSCSDVKIDIGSANRIAFKAKTRRRIIRSLKIVLSCDIPVFNISQRQLFMYLASHSNLGSWESIKKAVQRCKLESGDINSFFNVDAFKQRGLGYLKKGQNGDKTEK